MSEFDHEGPKKSFELKPSYKFASFVFHETWGTTLPSQPNFGVLGRFEVHDVRGDHD